jgi:hypothetical protein
LAPLRVGQWPYFGDLVIGNLEEFERGSGSGGLWGRWWGLLIVARYAGSGLFRYDTERLILTYNTLSV